MVVIMDSTSQQKMVKYCSGSFNGSEFASSRRIQYLD